VTTATDLSALLVDVAAEAATAVADQLRAAFRAGMDIDYKRDAHDPVTVHDKAAEARIREVILSRVPDSTIVGEEGGAHGNGRVHWYVDPIDGTANFARGLAFFCTSIGAVVDGEVVAGAVLDPMAGHLFTATPSGAWLNGEPLTPRGAPDEAHALIITSYPSARELARDGQAVATDRFTRLISSYSTLRRTGSAALTLSHVAAGWADAALSTSINGWDVCAAQLLVRSAGAVYQPFTLGSDEAGWDSPGFIAHHAGLDPVALNGIVADMIGTGR